MPRFFFVGVFFFFLFSCYYFSIHCFSFVRVYCIFSPLLLVVCFVMLISWQSVSSLLFDSSRKWSRKETQSVKNSRENTIAIIFTPAAKCRDCPIFNAYILARVVGKIKTDRRRRRRRSQKSRSTKNTKKEGQKKSRPVIVWARLTLLLNFFFNCAKEIEEGIRHSRIDGLLSLMEQVCLDGQHRRHVATSVEWHHRVNEW